jgi:hypothetical protein
MNVEMILAFILLYIWRRRKMRISFTADIATYDEFEGVLVAGLAVDDGSRSYLNFQRSSPDNSDDWGVYLEYNDQSNSGYNVISACRLSRFKVEVNLCKPLSNLQNVTGFDVELEIKDATYECFVQGIMKIFRGETE